MFFQSERTPKTGPVFHRLVHAVARVPKNSVFGIFCAEIWHQNAPKKTRAEITPEFALSTPSG